MTKTIRVHAAFDDEARVWFTQSPDVHGLRIEAATVEELVARIPGAVQDLLEGADGFEGDIEVPIEVIAHTSAHILAA